MTTRISFHQITLTFALIYSSTGLAALQTADQCENFGKTALVGEFFAYIQTFPLQDVTDDGQIPYCLDFAFHGFQHNPSVGINEMRLGLVRLRQRMPFRAWGGLLTSLNRESPRFRSLLRTRMLADVDAILRERRDLTSYYIGTFVSLLPYFLTSPNDKPLSNTLERLIVELPAQPAKWLYTAFKNSPLAEIENIEHFIQLFRNRSETIYRFLDDMSWIESLTVAHEQLEKGFPPNTENYIGLSEKVLNTGRPVWTEKVVDI